MFSKNKEKIIKNNLPLINYIWIGDPVIKELGVPGHDTFGPIQMARYNKTNTIIFWCLEKNTKYYAKVFKKHEIQVCSVENFLKNDFSDRFIKKSAMQVQDILLESLRKERNTIRDRVSVKNMFSLFILMAKGDYVLDTNVKPLMEQSFFLPRYNVFKTPAFFNIAKTQKDFWMIYAPPHIKWTREIFATYCKFWLNLQAQYEKEGYSENFHATSSTIMFKAIYNNTPVVFWHAKEKDGGSYAVIEELGIVKSYYNTHKIQMRFEFNKPESLLRDEFNHFLNKTQLSIFKTPTKNIIFDYLYEGDRDVNMKSLFKNIGSGKEYGEIFLAISFGDTKKLNELIDNGADVNQQMTRFGIMGETPLHYAIINRQMECGKILLEKGARLDLKAKYAWSKEALTSLELCQYYPDCNSLFESSAKKKVRTSL